MQLNLIDESAYAQTMTKLVRPALAGCRDEGWFNPAQAEREAGLTPRGGGLHYLCYDATKFDYEREDGATAVFRGAIVISHGFTEFAEKYDELVWYFLKSGYSVCVMDHRGHGKSARDVDNPSLVWIDDWHRYVADLAGFARTIGQQYAAGEPINLFCHSMGGGIGAAALEQYPSLFDRAVLSCPMIAPQTGMPMWLTRALVDVLCACGMGRHRVFGQKDFDGVLDLGPYQLSSEPRERWYHQLRCDTREYQTYCASFEWVRQAMRMNRAILKPSACAEIETPILLFQAGHDIWVRNKPQNVFVNRVVDGGGQARLVHIADSEHEIFSMPNAVFGPYLEQVLAFFSAPMIVASEG
ncbi:alpha/beta fold hydrolase [Bifidobacterium callitrichos]|nr:alpha/beta fold hydrolase [Bifidobacterium callitrichos]